MLALQAANPDLFPVNLYLVFQHSPGGIPEPGIASEHLWVQPKQQQQQQIPKLFHLDHILDAYLSNVCVLDRFDLLRDVLSGKIAKDAELV